MKTKVLIFIAAALPAFPLSTEQIIQKIKGGDRKVLAAVADADMEKIHNHQGIFFYIPRIIGQPAVRSLFGCFENKSARVRKICADSLYQMKLNYVHKKFIVFLAKKESEAPVRMALEDVIVRMNEDRFNAAREHRDAGFLMKVNYDELSVIAEKGLPASKAFDGKDIIFLTGGLENTDPKVRIFCVKMLGRITDMSVITRNLLTAMRKKEKSAAVIREIDISIACLKDQKTCPDLNLQGNTD